MEGEKGMEVRYYICKHCGNIVEKVKDKGVPVICCGEPMQELKAGVTDAAVEKHIPVYTIEGSHVHVVVGETKHPMLEAHFIEWITLNTNQGIYRKQLNPRWVYDKLKPEIPDLSLGTVYRNIALFKDEGKVSVICNVNGEERKRSHSGL